MLELCESITRRLDVECKPSLGSGPNVKTTVTLEIAGAKYRMVSDADETHLQNLARLVNERVQALGDKAGRTASPNQVLALVALGLADDLVSAENRLEKLQSKTRDAIQSAIARIDQRLIETATGATGRGEEASHPTSPDA